MEKNWFFKSKLVIFVIQIVILSLIIYSFDYKFDINFEIGISKEHKKIIQFLANYIMFDNLYNLYFIYSIWIIISLIPIFMFNNYKKAYSMNLTTFFFPNFFFYVFLRNHYRPYFNENFLNLFLKFFKLSIYFWLKLERIIIYIKNACKLCSNTIIVKIQAVVLILKKIHFALWKNSKKNILIIQGI